MLQQAGRGNHPNKARNLTKEEEKVEEVLRKEGKLRCTTPEALVNKIGEYLPSILVSVAGRNITT